MKKIQKKKREIRFKIRTKILVTFLGLSVVSLILFGYVALSNIKEVGDYAMKSSVSLGDRTANDSTAALKSLGEKMIEQKANDTSKQVEIYLKDRPNMTTSDIINDTTLHNISVQSVGQTGYTAIVDATHFVILTHPRPSYVGLNLTTLKTTLPSFWAVIEPSAGGNVSKGYYDWKEPDNSTRLKYAHIAPINVTTADGESGLTLWATTYIDEFSKPVEETKKKIAATTSETDTNINDKTKEIQNAFFGIFIAMILAVLGMAFFISGRITCPIISLTKSAKAIGGGELDTNIEVKSTDEIGDLAKSFDNMRVEVKKRTGELVQSEKMASIGLLVAGVSHEINNPLAYIELNTSCIKEDLLELKERCKEKDKETKEILERIGKLIDVDIEGINRIATITKTLKRFAKPDEEGKVLTDINQGIKDTLVIVHNQLKHRVNVHEDYGDISNIKCNIGQLNQVFMNLIINASDAMDKGDIWIKTWIDDKNIYVEIKDNGQGIPSDKLNKIFDPFYTTKKHGTGLGLSISYRIIQEHDGKINVESKVGEGTKFTVILPKEV